MKMMPIALCLPVILGLLVLVAIQRSVLSRDSSFWAPKSFSSVAQHNRSSELFENENKDQTLNPQITQITLIRKTTDVRRLSKKLRSAKSGQVAHPSTDNL